MVFKDCKVQDFSQDFKQAVATRLQSCGPLSLEQELSKLGKDVQLEVGSPVPAETSYL